MVSILSENYAKCFYGKCRLELFLHQKLQFHQVPTGYLATAAPGVELRPRPDILTRKLLDIFRSGREHANLAGSRVSGSLKN